MMRIFAFFATLLILLVGCVNNDYSKISNDIVLTPNYSFPVGAQSSTTPTPISNSDLASIVLLDTIQYSLVDLANKREYIDWLMFRVNSTNSYPAEIEVSADYYDASGNFLGSFTKSDPLILAKPFVDGSQGTTSQSNALKDYYLTTSEIDQIMNMDYIIITTTISNLTLTDELRANWDKFSIYTSVGIQVQIIKQN